MKYLHALLILIVFSCSDNEKKTFLGPEAQFTESGLEYIMLEEGKGPEAELGNEITTNCILKVGDSTVVWETSVEEPFVFVYSTSGMIDGFIEAIGMMNEGDRMKVIIPPELGYGSQANETIPANAYLSFEIDMIKVDDPRLWVADTLLSAFQKGGIESGLRLYSQMKEQPDTYYLSERHLAVLGSLLKKDGRLNDNLEVAKLRAEEYPDSFGAHLNLANIYVERGEKSLAREELNICLEISPDNPTALRKLEEL